MTSFRTNAIAGGAIVTLLLASGMWSSIRSFDVVAAAQMARIRAEEQEITLAERLRWSGELVASTERSYLISRDPAQLTQLLRARQEFDHSILALGSGTVAPRNKSLIGVVERNATNLVRVQEELAAAPTQAGDVRALVMRFESELIPMQRQLSESLDRLVAHKEAALVDIYDQTEKERDRLAVWMYSLLAGLILLGSVITAYFAKQTARAYRKERGALEIARKAVAARDELMGIVAHDLRNPLMAISIKAASLRKRAEAATAKADAESITDMTMRMDHLIKCMLDVTIMEAGRFSIEPTTCEVGDLLRKTTEIFATLCESKQIGLSTKINDTRIRVRADRERVLQVLSNLLGNAIKFTPHGSEVTISVEALADSVRFAVSDTGPGISHEHLPHVFDRFWKQESSQKKGTGLGLFIAKGIVDAHAGRIWVESEPDRGTTFYFTLPIAASDERAADQD